MDNLSRYRDSVVTRLGDAALVTPDDTEVRRIMAVNFTNIGISPMTVNLTLGGMIIIAGQDVPPGQTVMGSFTSTIFSMSGLDLAVVAATGTAAELSTSVCSTFSRSMRDIECRDAHLIRFKKCALLLETTKGNL
jgi:hypothetical protein